MLAADAAARGAALRRRGQATEKQHACGHGHAGRLPHGVRHAEPSKSQEEPHRGSLSQRRLSRLRGRVATRLALKDVVRITLTTMLWGFGGFLAVCCCPGV